MRRLKSIWKYSLTIFTICMCVCVLVTGQVVTYRKTTTLAVSQSSRVVARNQTINKSLVIDNGGIVIIRGEVVLEGEL